MPKLAHELTNFQPDNQTFLVRNSSTREPPSQHPLLSEILAHNLPPKPKSVQHAWTNTLLTSPHDSPSLWLHNLYQATLEASNVPEMTVTSRVSVLSYCLLKFPSDDSYRSWDHLSTRIYSKRLLCNVICSWRMMLHSK